MTKQDLIAKVAEEHPNLTKKEVAGLVDEIFDDVMDAVRRDGKFTFSGIGTWTLKKRKARIGRNPQTGAEVKIPASKTVGFKVAKALKESL